MSKTAAERRDHRRSKSASRRGRKHRDDGPMVVSASLEEMLAAIRELDPDLRWADIEGSLLPIFRRRRPMPSAAEPAVYLERPPGVEVGIGVDIGPAFLHVSAKLLEDWQVTADDALARAVENVRERANGRRLEPIAMGEVSGVPTAWFQSGESIGSALLLLPEEIAKRFGRDPQLIIAPMRDLLVSLPLRAGVDFAAWLHESIAEEDPNCLDLPVFSLIGGQLAIATPPRSLDVEPVETAETAALPPPRIH